MKRGEIRWYRFKSPDKKRPVLILSRDSIIPVLGEVTIVPVTSTVRGIPSEVFLNQNDGLPKECAVNLDHIQTVNKQKIGRLVTALSKEKMQQVKEALMFALQL